MDFPKPSKEEIIQHSKTDHLYCNDFGEGRFFSVVTQDATSTEFKIAPRTSMKVVYIGNRDDIEGLEIAKLVNGKLTERLNLSKFNLAQLEAFLALISSLDLKNYQSRRVALSDKVLGDLTPETKQRLCKLLSDANDGELISDMLDRGAITSRDIVNTGYRKQQLKLFHQLLYEGHMPAYKKDIGSDTMQEEKAWQHFFAENQWIFGYGLDYRFQGILQREFHASDTTAAGRDGVIADYLLGDKLFTTFVELKLPSSPIFGSTKNRSQTWRLSTQLIDSYSQILTQKASGQIKLATERQLYDDCDNQITQKAYDSKTVLVYGCWSQIEKDKAAMQAFKEKSFELFRRDSRNVDIITYDELYDRAKYIVDSAP